MTARTSTPRMRSRLSLIASIVAFAVVAWAVVIAANGGIGSTKERGLRATAFTRGENGTVESEGSEEIRSIAREQMLTRTLPGGSSVNIAGARLAALGEAADRGVTGGTWDEVQDVPYFSDDPEFRDPIISNSGAGSGNVTGRMTALAIDGDTVYAGGADGGVWRSDDGGDTWVPLTDHLPSLSSGSLAVNAEDHSVWYGTGEANTSFDSYLGTGIYRSTDGGETWRRIGAKQFVGSTVARITFDGYGKVYAATSRGVYRRPVDRDPADPWTPVLQPGHKEPYSSFRIGNDVQVRPGTEGQTVVANVAWRDRHTSYNGFYVSREGGDPGTWTRARTEGIDVRDTGRAELAYSADGSKLYTVVESIRRYNLNPESALMGVFVSSSGSIKGPWKLKADYAKLAKSPGSALKLGQGYAPGIQIWYNQFIGVDPADPDHVYMGLEEVYETTDGGTSWTTIGPYWNFGLPCSADGQIDTCPPTTHSDQHVVAFSADQVWVGNDGGIYSRDLQNADGWENHNEHLRTLQYYYGGVGEVDGGLAYSGGLQDNGGALLLPGEATMVSPFGGDGGDVIVDPDNGLRIVHEYVGLDMWSTTNGGQTDGSDPAFREITPACGAFTYTPDPCDPAPRFIAPFDADVNNIDHWVAGGQYVWETHEGWDTRCGNSSCDWEIVHNNGAGSSTTAVVANGETIYAAWCAFGCNPGPYFSTGIDTNYGGRWHRVAGPDVDYRGARLPQRYVFNLAVDPEDDGHIYAVYSAYSRRWIPGAGRGVVFESHNGGTRWTDITGDLPDAPGDDLVIGDGSLVLSTDVGVFTTDSSNPGVWQRFGTGLPNAVANDLTVTPDGTMLVAVTHGRGMWQTAMP
jgi:photosystem II stability/assembly factor-like uncharacterized protein